MPKSLLALFAVLACTAPALAQQATPALNDLDAERLSDGQVKIEFEYQGGACETVLPATLGDTTGARLAVTFPTQNAADVCTMQVVEIEVNQSIPVATSVTDLDITLLTPDGAVAATGTTRIEDD